MDNRSLKRIVRSLVNHYGENGAKEYICTGDYSLDLKTRALGFIHHDSKSDYVDVMAVGSDMDDVASAWKSESNWNSQFAS